MEKPEIVTGVYLPHEVSQSRIKRYLTCPKLYEYNDVLRVRHGRDSCGASLPMGTTFHAAAEVFHETIRKGFEPDMDVLMNLIDKTFREEYEKIVAPTNLDHARGVHCDSSLGYDWRQVRNGTLMSEVEGSVERAIKNIQWWFECYTDAYERGELDIFNNIEIGCEIDYRREIPHIGLALRGKVDVALNPTLLADWKTANPNKKWNWSQNRAEGELQASFYAALMNEEEIEFAYVVIDKQVHPDFAKTPKKCDVKVITTKRTQSDIKEVIAMVEWFAISSDIRNNHQEGFFHRKTDPVGEEYCDNFCDFKTRCYTDLQKERNGE
jgi:hypothetical protein